MDESSATVFNSGVKETLLKKITSCRPLASKLLIKKNKFQATTFDTPTYTPLG